MKLRSIFATALASIFGGSAFAAERQEFTPKPDAPRPKKPRGKSISGASYGNPVPRDAYGVTYEWRGHQIVRTSERISKLSRADRRRIWSNSEISAELAQ